MLCRALLAAVVLSYVLCVLLLSGVQKEDLDEGTLRKLQRHNVNIDDINDQKLKEHCFGKTDVPNTLTTLTIETSTETTINTKEIPDTDKNVGSLTGGTTQLEKIVEYLENKYNDQRIKALEFKDDTEKSTLKLIPLTTIPPNTFRNDHEQRIDENPNTEKLAAAVTNNDDEKNNKNTELKNLMKVWQANIDRLSDTTQRESTTIQIIKDEPVHKNTNDIEYISKIVAEIMSKRQFDNAKTSNVIPQNNLNETFPDADLSAIQNKNKRVLPTNYYLNNCNLGNFYANKQAQKEKKESFNNLYNRGSSYGGNVPDTATKTNNDYVICQRVEEVKDNKALHSDRVDDNTINYILTKLKKEAQRFNGLDNESPKAVETSSENKLKGPFNRPSTNSHRQRLNILDNESAKALETVLENQSKNILFNRQSDHVNASNIYGERLNLFDKDSTKVFDTTIENRPKILFFDQQSHETTNTNKEKQHNYDRFVEENKKVWEKYFASVQNMHEPKLNDEQTQSIINKPNFHHDTAKQDDHALDEEYKRWLLTFHKPIKRQGSMMETKLNSFLNNRGNYHEKSSNILNSIPDEPYDANFGYHYKRPWLYGGVSNEQSKARIKGKQDKTLFKPENYEKVINSFGPRLENTYEKKIPPYFEPVPKNKTIIPIQGEIHKNSRESITDDVNSPQIVQRNYWERSREFIDASKKYSDFIGWYQNKTPFIMEDRSPKQLEYKGDKELNIGRMQTGHQNKILHLPDGGYKTDWAYFRNEQRRKQYPNIEEHDEETEYFINTKSSKKFKYQYPPRPYEVTAKIPLLNIDTAKNDFTNYISKDNLSNDNENKLPSFPLNVIKDIANSVKEIVLRDLKSTTLYEATINTTTPTATTTTPTTTTSTATTITPTTTSTTRTTTTEPTPTTTTPPTTITTTLTTTTTKSTVTEGASITTAKPEPLKVQDASKALEKIMEIFEKISSMKDKIVKLDNVKSTESVRQDKTTIATTRDLIIQNQEPAQLKREHHVSNGMQPIQMKVENRIRYPENLTPYNVLQKQHTPENLISYGLPFIQRTPENSLLYGMKSPYYHSKMEYDPYIDKEVLEYTTRKTKVNQVPRGQVITVQTNSGEIAPLKIAVQKPGIQNVVLTTKQPIKETSSDEIFNYRNPLSSSARHQVDNIRESKESSHIDKPYIPKHTHTDAHMNIPKSRKIKNQHAFTEQYQPQNFRDIERFHEKLEREDSWPPFEESQIPKRMQRPLAKKSNYDDTHFRNFLHTQQKVNAMLEKILGSAKTTPVSAEII